MKVTISISEIKFVEETIKTGLRLDGRTLRNGRNIDIAFSKDYGSCIVMQGNTRILAQVSCEMSAPKPARPSEGTLHINLELSPMADPDFRSGAMSDEAVEISRLLERCIRDSRSIDLESLCVVSGEKVWTVRVDVHALNNDGNIIECASIATIAALAHFRRPHVTVIGTDVKVHSLDDHNPVPLTLHHMPVVVNLAVFDEQQIVVDPLILEERVARGKIIIGMNAHQEICLLHFSGPVCLKKEIVAKCTDIAAKRAQTLTQIIRAAIDNDNYQRSTNQPTGFTSLLHSSTILGSKRAITQIDSSKFTVDEVEEIDLEEQEVNVPREREIAIAEDSTFVSGKRQEVQKFLERPEVAIFEGGQSRWQLDEDSSDDEDVELSATSTSLVKKEKVDETGDSIDGSGESSEEEERVFIKSEHVDGSTPSRGWYSKNPFSRK